MLKLIILILRQAGGAGEGQQSNIMFVRGETQSKAVNEMVSAENPDEIDISDEDEEEEEGAPVKKVSNVEEMDVPEAVFGSLKKNNEDNQ